MSIFSHRQEVTKQEFRDLQQKIASFELEMEKIRTHIISLRGLVNKKLGYPSEIKSEKEDNYLNSVLLPEK